MKDKISVNVAVDLNHTYECPTDILGREGEGNTSQLEITIPEQLCNCSVYIDFEKPNGETLRTPKLEVVNGVATYDVPQFILTDSGEIKVQLVFQKDDGTVWKSSIKKYHNQKSINAVDDIPEKEDFISEAQKLIDQLSGEVEEVAKALANDTDFVNSIIDTIEEADWVRTITGSRLRFFVGTKAEYDALTDTENLFAIITDDTTKDEIINAFGEVNSAIEELATQVRTNGSSLVMLAGEIEAHKLHQFKSKASGTIASGSGVINTALDKGVYLVVFDGTLTRSGVGYFGANTGSLNMYNVMLGDLVLVYGEVAGSQAEVVLVPSHLSWNTALKDGTNQSTESGTLTFYKIGTI